MGRYRTIQKRKSLLREMLCGLLLGLMIMPAQPAQAQFGFGVVFDPRQYTLQIQKRLEEAKRWADTIKHYQEIYTNAVNQLTTLRGVLQTVDRTLAKNMELARLTNDIGAIIRGSYLLQNQVRNMVRYQVAALQQIDDRLRNGIFDPDKDRADFEEYLLYSMGRNSRQTVQLAVRTAQADAQVSKWMTERQKIAFELATAQSRLKEYKNRLNQQKDNPDPSVTQPLNESIQQTEIQIALLQKNLTESDDKIQQRIAAHGLRLSDMENFGYQIESTKYAWRELQNTKDEIAETFDAAILQMQPPAP
jgi:predicted RNase H-like nuclease (RuvC/YqgF family)